MVSVQASKGEVAAAALMLTSFVPGITKTFFPAVLAEAGKFAAQLAFATSGLDAIAGILPRHLVSLMEAIHIIPKQGSRDARLLNALQRAQTLQHRKDTEQDFMNLLGVAEAIVALDTELSLPCAFPHSV